MLIYYIYWHSNELHDFLHGNTVRSICSPVIEGFEDQILDFKSIESLIDAQKNCFSGGMREETSEGQHAKEIRKEKEDQVVDYQATCSLPTKDSPIIISGTGFGLVFFYSKVLNSLIRC